MKRTLPVFLALLLLLCGCGTDSADTTAEEAALTQLLLEIDNTMQPGTAGSSLKAAYLAASLLDWSRSTALEEAAIAEVTKSVLEQARTDSPVSFTEKMQSVYNAYELLMTPAGEDILSDCGYTGEGFPWSEEDAASFQCIMKIVTAS